MKNKLLSYWVIGLLGCLSIALSPIYASSELPDSGQATFSLNDAINYALKNSKSLAIAEVGVKSAEDGVTIARAGFLPHINLQASYTKLGETPAFNLVMPAYGMLKLPVFDTLGNKIGYTNAPGVVGADTMALQMGYPNNYVGQISLQQSIFTFGKLFNVYQIAELNLSSAKQDYQKQKNDLVFQVKQAFYSILVLKELTKVTVEAYNEIEEHTKVAEQRYNDGLASNFDLLRAKVQLANMEPQVLKVKDGLELSKMGFKTILGLPQDTLIEIQGTLEDSASAQTVLSLQDCISKAQANRPDIKSLSLKKQMADKSVSLSKKANLPNLVFAANYDYEKPLSLDNEWGSNWNMTFALQMPLFTGFENLGRMKQAKAQLKQVDYGLKLLEDGAEMEVRSAYLQLEEAKKLLVSQKENVTQAEEALKIINDRYKEGLATSLDVMDTQLALTQARTNQLQALSDYLIAKASLEKATGSPDRGE